jgi:adenine-specific DNA-methyltransferase
MNKLKMESLDMTQANIEKIGALFPNVITETLDEERSTPQKKVYKKVINFEKLKQELSSEVVDNSEESYDFTWVGKNDAIVEANSPIRKTLRPCIEESKNFETTENLYIEGDNLDVLKLLQESYLGQVKMIYIDPPYNTGKDFIYKDNFHKSADEYDEESGMYDDEGNKQFTQNNDTNPRFHSDWCSMIYPRLRLAKNLLTDDGVIFISIDDNEVDNLKKICNEVFGESNFITQIIWKKKYGIQNDAKYFSTSHEYILLYAKSISAYKQNLLPRTIEQNERYKNPDNDQRGVWKSADLSVGRVTDKDIYEITLPSGRKVLPSSGRSWVVNKEKFEKLVVDNRIWFGADGNSVPSVKKFLTEVKDGRTATTIWEYTEVGHTDKARKELNSLFDNKSYFDYPKSIELIKRMLILATDNKSTILDFFSGSATTAHAVMQLNAEDGGNRKFICVQLPELCDEKSEAYKAGYKTICEIGKERIRRAGEKIKAEIEEMNKMKIFDLSKNTDLQTIIDTPEDKKLDALKKMPLTQPKKIPDIGFRVLKLDETNMKDVYYGATEIDQTKLDEMVSNIKDDRTDLDLLYGILLDWGLQLSSKHEIMEIEGVRVHNYDDLSLVACFEEKISESVIREIAKMQPLRVVFRDSCFANSPDKINIEEIFKINSPSTSVRVI